MSPTLHHECTRVPVTALSSCGALLIAAEGPFLRLYHAKSSTLLASRRVFEAQAIHGISVYAEDLDHVTKLVVWGGRLVRALWITASPDGPRPEALSLCLSNVGKAPDWILDLAPRMSSFADEDVYNQGTCAAVTAHNALLEITIHHQNTTESMQSSLSIRIKGLTASSRSILYSAHLLWESSNCILVAAGTAFGEIMYWSWAKLAQHEAQSQIHQVFLGHEGSIFDVRISKELQREAYGRLKRVIASCSDDRTIRLWDVSSVDLNADGQREELGTDAHRTRHTGFSVAAADEKPETSNCLAIGWGHTSRVWRIRFLESSPCDGALGLVSAGEDATSRTWKLAASTGKGSSLPCTLQQTNCSAHHSGKNIWSVAAYREHADSVRVACGAADGKITTHPLVGTNQNTHDQGGSVAEYSLQDLLQTAECLSTPGHTLQPTQVSKKGDSIRSYCFVSDKTFLLITNSGKVLLNSFGSDQDSSMSSFLRSSALIDRLENLSGYSTCTGNIAHKTAFLAGTKGGIYMYCARNSSLRTIHTVTGKVSSLFAADVQHEGQNKLALLITLVGHSHSQLLFVDTSTDSSEPRLKSVSIPVSETLTGATITSMSVTETQSGASALFLGYRRGSITLYTIPQDTSTAEVSLLRTIDKVHRDETVTALLFQVTTGDLSVGHLYSVGRDGCLAVHVIDIARNIMTLVHNLTLPIGPNIEGLYIHQGRLLVHGFSSKKWILYDVTAENEIMGIETGGAHRSWAYQPSSDSEPQGGTLVWTRTSSLHICNQVGSNHGVLRFGGHGREIKAVAISPPILEDTASTVNRTLIATGAEDTDIKIFTYDAGELVCRRTLRKHTTGIQHIQWSDNGEYLFSSAGSEEFYIWRVRFLSTEIDIGVVCESVYKPESEFSDLRIMSFDVHQIGGAYTIAMVFSDSSVKTYQYSPNLTPVWQPLASGIYSTSCLTQAALSSPTLLFTAGTDGHAAFWPLPCPPQSSSSPTETKTLHWKGPLFIHQNASKTLSRHPTSLGTLLISGGDDGALAFILTAPDQSMTPISTPAGESGGTKHVYARPPVIVVRAHGSAVTASAILRSETEQRVYVLTSGNDEWVRLWSVEIGDAGDCEDCVRIKRLSRCKTSVADVSSMAIVDNDGKAARVLVCGVGMEVIRVDFGAGE